MRKSSLNQTYRLIWSEVNNAWVAVSELTRARGKRSGAAVSVALVIGMLGTPAWATTDTISASSSTAYDLNSGNTVIVNSGISLTGNPGIHVSAGTGNTIDNSGTLGGAGYGINFDSGTSTTITNESSGTISATSDYLAGIDNLGTISTLTNNGVISAAGSSSTAILNDGTATISTLTNNGTIRATGSDNWAIFNMGTISTLTNYGTISATANGGNAIVNFSGSTIGALTNNGTISAAANGYAINNQGTITNGITNTGTLDGAVNLGGATLNLDGTSGRVTGVVTGTGSTVNVNGTFTTENTFNVGTFNIASGGTLNMMNNITTASGFNNHGTLAVADGVTAIIYGNYTQDASGTLATRVADDTHYSKLNVTGTVTLGGALFVDASTATTLGSSLTNIIHASGGVSGTFATYSDNSSLFNFAPVYNANSVDLSVTAAGGGNNNNQGNDLTAYGAVTTMGNRPATGAARVLDSIFQNDPSGDISRLFYGVSGTQAVSDAVAETLPLFTTGMNQVASNNMHGTNRVIQARQEGNHGISSGDDFLGDRKFWLKPVGSWTRQNDRKGVAGYNADTYGLVAGLDGEIDESTRIGIALSYMNSNVDGKSTSSGNSADVDAYQAIVYGSRTVAAISNTEVNWQADLGLNKNNGRRVISFVNRVAKSDYDSTTAHIGVGIARNYSLNDKTTVTPAIRADYTYIRDESYTEKGAGALNLKVNSHSTDELIVLAEGRLSHQLTDKATLVANAGVGYDVLDGKNSMTASYVGGGTAFSTQGMDVSPWLGRAGVGLTINASERTEISARYDLEGRSDFLDQTASVKVRWAF